MSSEPRMNGLHARLARMVWTAAPTVGMHYESEDDALIVDLVEADAVDEVVAHDRLLVEFDGTDTGAMPTALYLTGVRAEPTSPAVALSAQVLGGELWSKAVSLVNDGSGRIEVRLPAHVAAARRRQWRGLARRLRDQVPGDPCSTRPADSSTVGPDQSMGDRVIGVEVLPGRVHAVLADGRAQVIDEAVVQLDRNDPQAVVEAIGSLARVLGNRHDDTEAARCALGVQLGGPVHTPTGLVEFYDKPLHLGDEPWKCVPFGDLLARETGRPAFVFNDAAALAEHEIAFGLGREAARFAVLVVRSGVGAELVRHGHIQDDLPLEIGVFIPIPASWQEFAELRGRSIEEAAGVDAITNAVAAVTGRDVDGIDAAAALGEHDDAVADVFAMAGERLAHGMAAIQAVVDPEAWALHAPPALVDGRSRASRAFIYGLGRLHEHLDYCGFAPSDIRPRATSGEFGARAAAVATLRHLNSDLGTAPNAAADEF